MSRDKGPGVRCANCGKELIPGKRFCHGCGKPATTDCPRCGQSIDPGFRYCPDCGASLGPVEEESSEAPAGDRVSRLSQSMPADLADKIRASTRTIAGERKLVTVLFCDLVGSTSIAEGLDPEEYRDLLDGYLAVGLGEVYRVEGIVTQLAGDGFMALFGAPVAYENAPERALRAALAIRDALTKLKSGPQVSQTHELQVRIGIHSGPVVVGAVGNDLKMDYTAIGDTTNLASRLQSLAEPGMILLSEATYRLVRGFAEVRPLGPTAVRGKAERVGAYALEGLSEKRTPMGRAAEHGLTPLVGRDAELAQLASCYDRLAARLPQIVTVVGDAGSGKSRLIYEFRQKVASAGAIVLEGRCSSLTQMLPYAAFVSMFAQFFGVSSEEAEGDVCDKLAARLEEFGHDDPSFPYLCRLLSVAPTELEELPADEVKQATLDAVGGFVLRASERAPVLMIVEDIQWMDDLSREILNLAAGRLRDAPIMIVVSHRPDYDHEWRAGAALTRLNLRPLSDEETTDVIRAVGGRPLPPGLERRILAKSEGNPFFTEEITRALFEQDYVVAADGKLELTRAVDEIPIPDTVQEVLGVRLDRLGPAAKRVAQVASVFGRQFHRRQLGEVLDGEGIEVDAALQELERRGVIHRKTVLSRDEFRFGESLAQEVAYETLLLKERRRLHERIALLIEASPGDRTADRWALLAHHFSHSENDVKAVEALLRAAADAEALPSYRVAVRLYRRAWDRAEASLARAENGDDRFRRWALDASLGTCRVGVLYGTSADPDAEPAARRARELAEALGDDEALAGVLTYSGMLKTGKRDAFAEGLALVEQALGVAHRSGSEVTQISISRGLAWSYMLDGRLAEAQRTITWVVTALEQREQRQPPTSVYFGALWMRSGIRYFNDDLEGALSGAVDTHELALMASNRTMESSSAGMIAQVHHVRGHYDRAKEWADRSLKVAKDIGSSGGINRAAAFAVAARAALGETAEISRYADAIEEGIAAGGNALLNIVFVVESFLAIGDLERAERIARTGYDQAAGRLREMMCAVALGDVTQSLGPNHYDEAERWYGQAITLARKLGSRSMLGVALVGAGELSVARGDDGLATGVLMEGRPLLEGLGLGHYLRRTEELGSRIESRVPRTA
ncbi:MAG: AAA family ATPase [Candidatus Binatia bacterium]